MAPGKIIDGCFPRPVEVNSYQFAIGIDNRAAGVATGCIGAVKQAD